MDSSAPNSLNTDQQSFQELSTDSKGGMLIVVLLIIVLAGVAYFVYTKSHPSIQSSQNEKKTSTQVTAKNTTDPDFVEVDKALNSLDDDIKSLEDGLNDTQGDLSE